MNEEQKALERAARGQRITFHTRHWWILEWIDQQPGKTRAARVWGIIDRAYRAWCRDKSHAAYTAYLMATGADRITHLCEAITYAERAGDQARADQIRPRLLERL